MAWGLRVRNPSTGETELDTTTYTTQLLGAMDITTPVLGHIDVPLSGQQRAWAYVVNAGNSDVFVEIQGGRINYNSVNGVQPDLSTLYYGVK